VANGGRCRHQRKENQMDFKVCPKCAYPWSTRDQFLRDPTLKLIGYQANFKALKTGILLFNHSCRTTLALQAHDFVDMYDGPVFVERATGSDDCAGHCLHQSDLAPCPARCECAFIRQILQAILDWPKAKMDDERLTMKHESDGIVSSG
jgi:hypothetical protein